MDVKGMDTVAELRRIAAQSMEAPAAKAAGGADFADILKKSVAEVAKAQEDAQALAMRAAQPGSEVPLHQVVAAVQEASLSFQTMVQARNKLVAAYQEIMNMQV